MAIPTVSQTAPPLTAWPTSKGAAKNNREYSGTESSTRSIYHRQYTPNICLPYLPHSSLAFPTWALSAQILLDTQLEFTGIEFRNQRETLPNQLLRQQSDPLPSLERSPAEQSNESVETYLTNSFIHAQFNFLTMTLSRV